MVLELFVGDSHYLWKVALKLRREVLTFDADSIYDKPLRYLLNYDDVQEKGFNCFSKGVILKKVWIENDVLMLDYNQKFENNRFGHLGLQVQIQQILWTAFAVSTDQGDEIKRISFLINGKRRTRIGGEGMSLKPFYTRRDLRRIIGVGKNV